MQARSVLMERIGILRTGGGHAPGMVGPWSGTRELDLGARGSAIDAALIEVAKPRAEMRPADRLPNDFPPQGEKPESWE
jgi:hypothetical protein